MATTTNFGWETPDDTDLVKDGAAAMRTLGNSIDTSFVDLKGGTSGQILSKASNTDLDYTWIDNQVGDITSITATSPLTGGGTGGDVTVGIQAGSTTQSGALQLTDSTSSTSTTTAATPNSVKTAYDLANAAIPKSLADAKGDIFTATADNTPARLPVGTNGQVLTADSTAATGLKWATSSSTSGPTFLAYNNANQTVTAGTWTKLNLNTTVFDTNTNFASSRFTPTVAGYYIVELTVTSNGTCYGVLYKNGSAYKYLCNSDTNIYDSGGMVVYMNGSTDYLEIYIKSSGATVYGGSSLECTFSGAWIRS